MRILIMLFIIRILSLITSCYVNLYILPVSDSVIFQKLGIDEYHLLFQSPHEYFINIFQNHNPHGYSRLLDDSGSFWNNLRTNLLGKLLSIFDLFSFKNFWINTLFFNFFVFFGSVALFRVFIRIFPKSFYPLIFCIFILPSALFFSSMVHRDGLILLSLSMIIYHLYFIRESEQYSPRRRLIIILFLTLIFLLRNFVLLALIPALCSWIIAGRYRKYAFVSFLTVYAFVSILFFSSAMISERANLPGYVTARQQSFIEIAKAASSSIPVRPLYPNLTSFLKNSPQALNHAVLRPYLSEINSYQYLPFAVEIFIIEIIFLLFIFFRRKKIVIDPLIYFCVFFSITMLLVTGYTVPIIGAIVRYRSIYLIFILIPLLCYMDWSAIRFYINKK